MSFRNLVGTVDPQKQQENFDKQAKKHGAALHKAMANKKNLRSKGTVNSWMEVFVLLNDPNHPSNQGQQRPPPLASPQHLVMPQLRAMDPYVAAGLVVPPSGGPQMMRSPSAPTMQSAKSSPMMINPPAGAQLIQQQQSRQVVQSVAQPKMGLKDYQQLPTPQNPKMVMAKDRQVYDTALEDQVRKEEHKLDELYTARADPARIMKQKEIVDSLMQQLEMVKLQVQQRDETRGKQIDEARKRAEHNQKMEIVRNAAAALPQEVVPELKGDALKQALSNFFAKNEPEANNDGRLEAVLEWTEERGVDKLCAMLREQYGRDLFGQQNLENLAVDQIQADRYARRLMGFYEAHGAHDMANWAECMRIGEWACKVGEANLNVKLRAKYGDDLDTYGQQIMLSVEGKLRQFYQRINADVLDKGLGPLLTWVVANGLDALNDMLREKYGEDLDGRKVVKDTRQSVSSIVSARAVLHRELNDGSFCKSLPAKDPFGEDVEEDLVEHRKEMLIKQLSSFLEVHDPKRLQDGGLPSLVQWAIPRSDKVVDELLVESYATDLTQEGLRRLSFSKDEEEQFKQQSKIMSNVGATAAKAATQALEAELNRAEVRSVRLPAPVSGGNNAEERPQSFPVSEANLEMLLPEPDF